MKNNLIEEDIARIKKLINNVLKERFESIKDENIISEAPIIPTLLNKFLGRKAVSNLETYWTDDAIRNLEVLFVKGQVNFAKNVLGKTVVKSASGAEVEMTTIAAAINAIAKKEKTLDEVINLLPRKLRDGTDFRTIFDTQLRKVRAKPKPKPVNPGTSTTPKPKPVNPGTSTTPKSKPKSKPGKTKAQITQDLLTKAIKDEESFKTYLVNELKEYSLPAMYKGKEQKFINEIWATIDKNSKGAITKFNNTIKDLEMTLDRLSYQDREIVLKDAVEGIKKSNKSLWDKFSQNFQFWSDPQYKSLTLKEKWIQTIKLSGYINIATAVLDVCRLFFKTENTEDLDWEGHFGMSPGVTLTMKVGAAAVPRMNVFFSTVLFVESLLRNIYEYSGLRKKIEGSSVKRNALGGAPPSEDEVDFNDNK
jgi:hypothetical protein